MVGEIRDLETADISIQATLTGHLVLSTLHTNNAAGAIPRFLSIGVKPYLLAPALSAIIAQRLVRRLCASCRKPVELDGETLKKVRDAVATIPEQSPYRVPADKPLIFSMGGGCDVCSGVGYKGRVGIFEVMTMNQELEKFVLAGNTSEYDITEVARKRGMLTMVQDGVLKALEGITSIDEVFRVAA
jgi:type II secretory ATPase GspE/PulE/Tfp pilus assembly ATPase PilB-like protein